MSLPGRLHDFDSGMSVTDAAAQSGIARSTVYKYISE
jgi:hypothetical protein